MIRALTLALIVAASASAQPPDVTPRDWSLDQLWTEVAQVNTLVDRFNSRKQVFADEVMMVGYVAQFENKPALANFLATLAQTPLEYGRVRTVNPYDLSSYAAYYDAAGRRIGSALITKAAALQAERSDLSREEPGLEARVAALAFAKRNADLAKAAKDYEDQMNRLRGKVVNDDERAILPGYPGGPPATGRGGPGGDRVFIDESAAISTPISSVGGYRGPLNNGSPLPSNGFIFSNPTPTPTTVPTYNQPTLYLPSPQRQPSPRAGLFRRGADRQPLFQGGLFAGNGGERKPLIFTGDGRALRLGALALSITGAAIGASSGGGGGGMSGVGGGGAFGGGGQRLRIDERFAR